MPFAEDLLEQAKHLANRETKRPRQASLRRAVSTAYYTLFHLLTNSAVKNWKNAAQRAALARAFDHRKMKDACGKTAGAAYPNAVPATVTHLRTVATAFPQLQQHRHSADYDNSKKWSRTEVLSHIDTATAAFDSWKIISKDPLAQDFLLHLLVQR